MWDDFVYFCIFWNVFYILLCFTFRDGNALTCLRASPIGSLKPYLESKHRKINLPQSLYLYLFF